MKTPLNPRPPPLSRVLARLAGLSLMGTAVAVGLWPLASATLLGLAVCEGLRLAGRRDPLAALATATAPDLDRSPLGQRWMRALTGAAAAGRRREPGLRAAVLRLWRRASGLSARTARALPYALLGTVGAILDRQIGLITLLVAAYPFLELARYHDALNRIRRAA